MTIRNVVPFATGSQFEAWKDFNCSNCYKYECESTEPEKAGCPLAFYLDIGSIEGTIPIEVAERIGIELDGNTFVELSNDCRELAHEPEQAKPKYINPNQLEMEL